MSTLPDGTPVRGKLFIVEGIDGSGKSTQLDLLHKWLVSRGYLVALTEWNSSPVVRQTTKRGKTRRLLSPTSFSLIHAADLADRIENHILPALRAGAIVLADRYIYTAFARDVARGVDRGWVRSIYRFAIQPTLALYFRVPLDESLQRILVGRPELKYYEAGQDVGLSEDPYESFRLFQARILDEYEQLVTEFGLTVVDAIQPLVQQQARVRRLVLPHLKGALKVQHRPWRAVLAKEGLHGRYLPAAGGAGQERG
jgi:dTMP kinase